VTKARFPALRLGPSGVASAPEKADTPHAAQTIADRTICLIRFDP
jgi:hypothetical protein